jgi:hypothetical protein
MAERKGPQGPKLRGPITEADWKNFDKLCSMQCSLVEIASFFGCDTKTIQTRVKAEYGEKFSVIYKEKRRTGIISLRRIMYQKALAGNIRLIETLARHYLGIGEGLPVDEELLKDDETEMEGSMSKEDLESAVRKRLERKAARDERRTRGSRATKGS